VRRRSQKSGLFVLLDKSSISPIPDSMHLLYQNGFLGINAIWRIVEEISGN
jgi:hypothetical protein